MQVVRWRLATAIFFTTFSATLFSGSALSDTPSDKQAEKPPISAFALPGGDALAMRDEIADNLFLAKEKVIYRRAWKGNGTSWRISGELGKENPALTDEVLNAFAMPSYCNFEVPIKDVISDHVETVFFGLTCGGISVVGHGLTYLILDGQIISMEAFIRNDIPDYSKTRSTSLNDLLKGDLSLKEYRLTEEPREERFLILADGIWRPLVRTSIGDSVVAYDLSSGRRMPTFEKPISANDCYAFRRSTQCLTSTIYANNELSPSTYLNTDACTYGGAYCAVNKIVSNNIPANDQSDALIGVETGNLPPFGWLTDNSTVLNKTSSLWTATAFDKLRASVHVGNYLKNTYNYMQNLIGSNFRPFLPNREFFFGTVATADSGTSCNAWVNSAQNSNTGIFLECGENYWDYKIPQKSIVSHEFGHMILKNRLSYLPTGANVNAAEVMHEAFADFTATATNPTVNWSVGSDQFSSQGTESCTTEGACAALGTTASSSLWVKQCRCTTSSCSTKAYYKFIRDAKSPCAFDSTSNTFKVFDHFNYWTDGGSESVCNLADSHKISLPISHLLYLISQTGSVVSPNTGIAVRGVGLDPVMKTYFWAMNNFPLYSSTGSNACQTVLDQNMDELQYRFNLYSSLLYYNQSFFPTFANAISDAFAAVYSRGAALLDSYENNSGTAAAPIAKDGWIGEDDSGQAFTADADELDTLGFHLTPNASALSAYIESPNDIDWYQISPQDGTADIQLTAPLGTNLKVEFWSPFRLNSWVMWSYTTHYVTSSASIQKTLSASAPATYRMKVTGYSLYPKPKAYDRRNAYTLNLTL